MVTPSWLNKSEF